MASSRTKKLAHLALRASDQKVVLREIVDQRMVRQEIVDQRMVLQEIVDLRMVRHVIADQRTVRHVIVIVARKAVLREVVKVPGEVKALPDADPRARQTRNAL